MAFRTSSLFGGGSGGGFIPLSHSGTLSIASGATGTILTITPPSGQRVRLDQLYAGTTGNNDITVVAGSETVIDSLNLSPYNAGFNNVGTFSVGSVPASTVTGTIENITCRYVDDILTITTLAATSSITYYSFTYGA